MTRPRRASVLLSLAAVVVVVSTVVTTPPAAAGPAGDSCRTVWELLLGPERVDPCITVDENEENANEWFIHPAACRADAYLRPHVGTNVAEGGGSGICSGEVDNIAVDAMMHATGGASAPAFAQCTKCSGVSTLTIVLIAALPPYCWDITVSARFLGGTPANDRRLDFVCQ